MDTAYTVLDLIHIVTSPKIISAATTAIPETTLVFLFLFQAMFEYPVHWTEYYSYLLNMHKFEW